jgi:amidohydrolase
VLDKANALSPELIRLRRDIHRHPELSFQEFRTAQLVADTLQEIGGITIRTGVGKTGVVGDLGNGEGPTIAIRADMDALPIVEQTGADYASVNEGVMHACGHDGHTAILLGVARLLQDCFAANGLRGRVRFLFQPAEEDEDEEGIGGAARMIADGALVGVNVVIALHLDSTQPCGTVTVHQGWNSAAVDSFEAWLIASGGHSAYPHRATDPIWMLGPVLMALHGIVARRIDPMEPAVVSLGQVHAGATSNVIPPEVYLHGTLRSFHPQVRQQLITEVEQALAVAQALGGDYRLKIRAGCPAGPNDPVVRDWLLLVGAELLGSQAVIDEPVGMGAEDFAYMCEKVPGAMVRVGSALPDGLKRPHHTNFFDIDERALPVGAAVLAETARRFLTGEVALPK